ncbi:OspG family effector kinase [Pseudomonas sp. S1_E04]
MTTLIPPAIRTRPMALPNTPAALAEKPESVANTSVPQPSSALKTALGDHCNRRNLADRLQSLIQTLPAQVRADASLSLPKAREQMETALASRLKSTLMYVCEDSSYPTQPPLAANRFISLEAYLLGCGMTLPSTLEALVELKDSVLRQAQVHPLGNFSGALSWPLAMPSQDQDSLVSFLRSSTSKLPGLPLPEGGKGTLGYLLSGSSVSDADLEKPVVALEKLLASPKAQALGRALQTRLGGAPTPGAGDDYVMTALHLGLDPQSQVAPTRNSVAGFDLAHSQFWGQPASAVMEGLGKHLLEQGRVSARTARLGAYLLLARTAPEYLVKDIPASVTYGSVMWAQLAMAVARIEAHTPGRTLSMGYAEILLSAEQLKTDPALGQAIDYDALRDWGVVNGFLGSAVEAPSANDMERVRAAYNHQLSALKTTSTLLQTAIPSRRTLALAQLAAAFPELDPSLFEVRSIQKARLKKGRPGLHPGLRSMLDIVMEGGKLGAEEHWISNDKRLPITTFCALYEQGKLGVATSFKTAYDKAIRAQEEGHQGKVRQLIATLPLEDRKNLEFGKLEFFHTNQYKIAGDLFTPPTLHVRGHTLEVKTTRNGQVNLYTIDTRRGTIEKENFLLRRRTAPYTASKMEEREANILAKTVLFEPEVGLAQRFLEQPEGTVLPDSFNSSRSQSIADMFVKSLDLKNDDLLKEARGTTSYDQDSARNEAISQFFLNLIPLRSAIVNFKKGNVGQGVFDLAVDAVGLITLGVGKAAHAGKVLGAALSTARQAAKAARFVGAALVEAFNPLSGLGDLLVGGGRLALSGGRYAAAKVTRQLNQLRGTAGSYDLLKAASKQHGEAATGTFKVAGEPVEGGAVLHSGQWYAVDTQTMRLYGRPIDDFVPGARAVDGELTHVPAAAEVVEPVTVKADLGPEIGGGAEGTIYESLDGKSVYKDFGPTLRTSADGRKDMEVVNLNKYYGEGFAQLIIEDGRKYIKMGKIDGVDLSKIEKGSLPPSVRSLLDDALAEMEAKDIYHNDLQLKNFMYSKRDNKVYPVDMNGVPGEFMGPGIIDVYESHANQLRRSFNALIAREP